jgi:DNA-binding NtrC family response regulator
MEIAMNVRGERDRHIAVLDAELAILDYVRRILDDRFRVSLFSEVAEFIRSLGKSPAPDLLLMDWHISDNDAEESALNLLARIRASKPSLPIVILACSPEMKEIVAAFRLGASDVVLKPFGNSEIDLAIEQCLKKTEKQVAADDYIQEIPLSDNTSFIRASKRMREVETHCTLVARTDIPVLIVGESGTGKEIAALLIHKLSARRERSFLKVNCAAMPTDLLESELFGYEPGAFTGAVKSKPGKFEICNNGTILLDEIGEMPTVLQAKLLQVLQDGCFSRLGSRSSVKVDVRVLAATNVDIKSAIAQKTFREDLYYRLNGFTLKMPPLRERTEEIPVLAQHFMRKLAASFGCAPLPISSALMQALMSHSWPGNLRELENSIKRYLVLTDEQAVIDELSPWHSAKSLPSTREDTDGNRGLKHMVRNLKGGAESAAIAQTLESTGWNRRAAANNLQISYKALLYKIKQYNLSPPRKHKGLDSMPKT